MAENATCVYTTTLIREFNKSNEKPGILVACPRNLPARFPHSRSTTKVRK
jgi:hypothetical protein